MTIKNDQSKLNPWRTTEDAQHLFAMENTKWQTKISVIFYPGAFAERSQMFRPHGFLASFSVMNSTAKTKNEWKTYSEGGHELGWSTERFWLKITAAANKW